MWSDNETTEDFLGFKVHADLLIDVIQDEKVLPVTIGVFGDWGSGKSSILKIIYEDLKGEDDDLKDETLVLFFNGWVFEGYDDAKAALLESIIDKFKDHKKLRNLIKDEASELVKSVRGMRVLGFAFKKIVIPTVAAYFTGGLSLIPFLAQEITKVNPEDLKEKLSGENAEAFLKDIVKEKESDETVLVREFRDDFKKMIDKSKIKKLVVIIDDLDRCTHDRIIENLEAIKLFLNVEKTAFIIGADPRIVRHAIEYRYRTEQRGSSNDPENKNKRIVNDYLEKLIQIPYILPRLSDNEVETYMTLLFCKKELAESYPIVLQYFSEFRQKNRYGVFGFADLHTYSYDKLYRLSAATYQAKTGGAWTKDVGGFNESLTYDENGNIKTLLRKAVLGGTITTIDDLTYSYKNTDYDNQIQNVVDNVTTNTTGYGYRNFSGTSSSTPYSYDDNGNLTADLKKNTTITYNEMNKPVMITWTGGQTNQVIEYRYDASGARISKYVTSGVNMSTYKSIEYVGGYVIEDSKLSYYGMAEGRVRNDGTGSTLSLKMEYFISDQQGNTRISFEDNGSGTAVLKQENSYYAFGMQMAGGYTPTSPNKHLYNAGSEWQDDIEGIADYYSTFYREYDPVIGRFNGVDPMAEADISVSTYTYSGNNPVNFNDPMGDEPKQQQPSPSTYYYTPERGIGYWMAWENQVMGIYSGNEEGRSGGGMSQFDYLSTYQGMKMRLSNFRNGPKQGFNESGQFGEWKSVWVFGGNIKNGLPGLKTKQVFSPLNTSQDAGTMLGREVDPVQPKNKYAKQTGTWGGGAQLSIGMGIGKHGTQLSVGSFGAGRVHQLFFTVTEPDDNSEDFSFDFSGSAQILVGYSKTGKFDLSGSGRGFGFGLDPLSFSYATDNMINPNYGIIGVGPSVGVKVSSSAGKSFTWTLPYITPFIYGLLPIRF